LTGMCGTSPHMAPEILVGRAYSAKVDVWALGSLAYVLLYGRWPYMPKVLSGSAMKEAIFAGNPAPTFRSEAGLPEISEDCSSWVRALLIRSPSLRPSAKQALGMNCFRKAWPAAPPMDPALRSAWRCGAFEVPGEVSTSDCELEATLRRLNAQRRHEVSYDISDVSTDVGLESLGQQSR